MRKVIVTKFAGRHREHGLLYVGCELEVSEEFFEANKDFLRIIDGSVGTSVTEEEDISLTEEDTNSNTEIDSEDETSDKEDDNE